MEDDVISDLWPQAAEVDLAPSVINQKVWVVPK